MNEDKVTTKVEPDHRLISLMPSYPNTSDKNAYVMIHASNVGNSTIKTIAESFNGNVDICIEADNIGDIEISE